MRVSLCVLFLSLSMLLLAGCGGGGGSSSGSGSGDWFFVWNCNGDSECLATNAAGTPSGSLDEGPDESACTPLVTFAQQFWGTAATYTCTQNPNGGGGGSGSPAVSAFSPGSTAPGNSLTITGTGFPTDITGVTVTIDGVTCTVTSATSTQIVCTLGAMGDFTGPITVKTSGGSVTSSASLTVLNHLYGVTASTGQFVAVGANGTLKTSSDGTTWTARTSGTALNLYAAASSGSAFVAVGQTGTVLRSTDGINWVHESLSGNSTDLFAVIWTGSEFVTIGDSLAVFTSPDGITWTQNSVSTSSTYGGLAWSGSGYVAVGGFSKGSPTIIKSSNASSWTTVSTTAPNGNQLLAATFGSSKFVAVGDAETVVTSPDGSTWTAQSESEVGDLQGIVWSGSQFVVVGFDSSATGSVILTSPDGVTWTSRAVSANNRSLNAVTFGRSEYVAVGGFGTIVTSLDGVTWTARAGI